MPGDIPPHQSPSPNPAVVEISRLAALDLAAAKHNRRAAYLRSNKAALQILYEKSSLSGIGIMKARIVAMRILMRERDWVKTPKRGRPSC